MPRVLLVERIAVGLFHRAIVFPFVNGWARARGIDARWLRFALPASARATQGELGVGLDARDTEHLVDLARAFAPTHVLVHPMPSPGVVEALRGAAPGARVGTIADREGEDRTGRTADVVLGTERSLAAFLGTGLDGGGEDAGNLFDDVTPHFGWEPAHALAAETPALPFLVCGEECTYSRTLRGNPVFEGIDLSSCPRPDGCTFCTRSAHGKRWNNAPEVLIRRQLEALRDTHPKTAGRLAIRALGEPLLRNVDVLARTLLEVGLPASDVLLDARVDTLLSCEQLVERALQRLAGSGHTLHLGLMGIENFSADELVRMNKGATWDQNLDAIEALYDLELRWPAGFSFRKHGGLSLILLTPWTRLADLSLNVAILRRGLLDSICGKRFQSRLRLEPGLPLHALAAHDGLLVGAYADRKLDTARAMFYADETPWRFADARLEPVNRLLVRMEPSSLPPDALDAELEAVFERLGPPREPLRVAEAIIDAALGRDSPQSPSALLAAAGPLLRTPDLRAGEATVAADSLLPSLSAVQTGITPVTLVEPDEGVTTALLAALRARPGIVIHRTPAAADAPGCTFVGHDAASVQAAVRQRDAMRTAARGGAWERAARELGRILGYPDCCAEAFAAAPTRIRDSYAFAHVRRRLEHAGEAPWVLNPGTEIISHVPCHLACVQSVALAESLLGELSRELTAARFAELERTLRRPWLMLVDQQRHGVELVTEDDPVGPVRYRAGRSSGASNELVRRVLDGDRLQIDDQQILVERGGRVTAALGARAFIWWYRAPVQAALWTRILALRFSESRAAIEKREAAKPAVTPGRGIVLLVALLREAGIGRERMHGFALESFEAIRSDVAQLTLRSASTELVLLVSARDADAPAYCRVGPFAIYHPRDQAIDTPEKQAAVRDLRQHLGAAIDARLDRSRRR